MAWASARAIWSWQGAHDVGNYWLLPINNTRFWFFIFFAASALGVAFWGRRRSGWAATALVSLVVAGAGSIWFWLHLANTLPRGVTRAVALEAQRAELTISVCLGALTLFAFAAFALGIRDLLREVTDLPPLEPVRSKIAG